MVKNEKGLWVKLKDIDDPPPSSSLSTSSSKGRGRGTGIPVLSNMYDINNNRSSS